MAATQVMQREPDPSENTAASVRVALHPSVTFSRRDVGGETTYVAYHAELGKYFRFGAEEHRIAVLLDGQRSVTEVLAQLDLDGVYWPAKDVADFVGKLVAGRLALTVEDTVASAAPEASANESGETTPAIRTPRKTWKQHVPRALSFLISQRIPLFHGHAIASRLESRVGWVFESRGMLAWAVLVLSGLMIVYGHAREFSDELQRMFNPSMWMALLVMWSIAKVIHEIGHAVAARHHDVRVGKIGIMFFFLAPLAYVDVTDAWKLRSRWQRVQIAFGGVYLELAVAALAAWAWWMLPPGLAKHLAAQFFLIAGPATLLVNANPLLRLDGYYVLSDLTEIPNLRMHGRRQLAAILEYVLFRIPRPRCLVHGWRRWFATCHALASVLFQIVWMGGLIIAVSVWARGLGVLLGLAAIALWAVLPLTRWVHKIWTLEPGEGRFRLNRKRERLLTYGVFLFMCGQYLCSTSSPLDRRVPVVVRFHDEQIARATADAFVQSVFVTSGQRIKKGTLLMELDDPELRVRRNQMADDLKLAKLRAIQFRRLGELAKSEAESENAASLGRQLAELDQQLEGLRVIALRDGLVMGTRIEDSLGSFISEGEELLRVSDPQEKELLASVSEDDMQAYQKAASRQLPATVRLRGGTLLSAVPASLRPRARRTLPHPALAATVGGPLAVEPSPEEDQQVRMVQPHLESVTVLDPITSVEVRAGQVGTMTISDNRSLVARLYDAALR